MLLLHKCAFTCAYVVLALYSDFGCGLSVGIFVSPLFAGTVREFFTSRIGFTGTVSLVQ